MKSELVCDSNNINNNNNNNNSLTTTNTSKNEQDNNNISINNSNNNNNSEMDCEYSVCAMFSIYYPMIENFNNFNINHSDNDNKNIEQQTQQLNNSNNNNNNNHSFIIPKIITPLSWSEITESDSSLYSSSPSSSVYSFSEEDFENTSQSDNIKNNDKKNKKKQVNKTSNNSSNNNNSGGKSFKKVFVGGISFDDIENDENLKKLRIEKIVHLFQSFGLVAKTNFHWNKGFFFIIYSNSKVAQNVVQSFSTFKKKQKYTNNIKESLLKEFKDTKATPSPNFYVRFPSNK